MRKLLVVISVAVLGFVGVGFLLPAEYEVVRERTLGAPPALVFDVLRDVRTWPRWSSWSREADPACTWSFRGADADGVPGSVRWSGPVNGECVLEVLDERSPERLRLALAFEDGETRLHSQLTAELVPVAAGTRVVWSLTGTMSSNPAHRWVGLFMDGALGGALESSLAGLEAYATGPAARSAGEARGDRDL